MGKITFFFQQNEILIFIQVIKFEKVKMEMFHLTNINEHVFISIHIIHILTCIILYIHIYTFIHTYFPFIKYKIHTATKIKVQVKWEIKL